MTSDYLLGDDGYACPEAFFSDISDNLFDDLVLLDSNRLHPDVLQLCDDFDQAPYSDFSDTISLEDEALLEPMAPLHFQNESNGHLCHEGVEESLTSDESDNFNQNDMEKAGVPKDSSISSEPAKQNKTCKKQSNQSSPSTGGKPKVKMYEMDENEPGLTPQIISKIRKAKRSRAYRVNSIKKQEDVTQALIKLRPRVSALREENQELTILNAQLKMILVEMEKQDKSGNNNNLTEFMSGGVSLRM